MEQNSFRCRDKTVRFCRPTMDSVLPGRGDEATSDLQTDFPVADGFVDFQSRRPSQPEGHLRLDSWDAAAQHDPACGRYQFR